MSTSVWAVLVQADCLDSLWVALPWSVLFGLTLARKEPREGGIVVRRVRVPADFEATPNGMTTVNHELGTELLVKYSKVKKVINTDGRQACFLS